MMEYKDLQCFARELAKLLRVSVDAANEKQFAAPRRMREAPLLEKKASLARFCPSAVGGAESICVSHYRRVFCLHLGRLIVHISSVCRDSSFCRRALLRL